MKKLEKPTDPFSDRRVKLPWESQDNGGVNPQMRTYTFMLDEGRVGTAMEKFEHVLNPDGKTYTQQRIVGPGSCTVPSNCRKMSYAEVCVLFQTCAADDISLRVGYGRLHKNALSPDEMRTLANSADYWVFAPKGAEAVKAVANKSVDDAFLKMIQDEPTPSVPSPHAPIKDKTQKLQTAGI